MEWFTSQVPISDLLRWVEEQALEIQPDFQRREVWSKSAQIMLVDTILKNIPMPKLYIQSINKGAKTHRKVIDGQQRIKAILAFVRGEFSLESPYEGTLAGAAFSDFPKEARSAFLEYQLDVNEIRDASDAIIREIYSRVNRYNIALNKQELRRADYPGDYLKLSEELALLDFFDDAKVFTIANRRRMGDVEYVSELLAILLDGPQDKRESLDEFYKNYAQWDRSHANAVRERFIQIVGDIGRIASTERTPIARTRFRQKADFYSLFAAVDQLRQRGFTLDGKDCSPLHQDIDMLNDYIAPDSDVELLQKYAIMCTSQANTVASRTWRRDLLRIILEGTYICAYPNDESRKIFHSILADIYEPASDMAMGCPAHSQQCAVCDGDISDYREDRVTLTWLKEVKCFQVTNAVFVHNHCYSDAPKAKGLVHLMPDADCISDEVPEDAS